MLSSPARQIARSNNSQTSEVGGNPRHAYRGDCCALAPAFDRQPGDRRRGVDQVAISITLRTPRYYEIAVRHRPAAWSAWACAGIIVRWRSNSAHLHRPWRAILRQSTLAYPNLRWLSRLYYGSSI